MAARQQGKGRKRKHQEENSELSMLDLTNLDEMGDSLQEMAKMLKVIVDNQQLMYSLVTDISGTQVQLAKGLRKQRHGFQYGTFSQRHIGILKGLWLARYALYHRNRARMDEDGDVEGDEDLGDSEEPPKWSVLKSVALVKQHWPVSAGCLQSTLCSPSLLCLEQSAAMVASTGKQVSADACDAIKKLLTSRGAKNDAESILKHKGASAFSFECVVVLQF